MEVAPSKHLECRGCPPPTHAHECPAEPRPYPNLGLGLALHLRAAAHHLGPQQRVAVVKDEGQGLRRGDCVVNRRRHRRRDVSLLYAHQATAAEGRVFQQGWADDVRNRQARSLRVACCSPFEGPCTFVHPHAQRRHVHAAVTAA